MKKLTRSSKTWHATKRKLNENTIHHPDFEIMTDGKHCYYLCKKYVKLVDKTEKRCEHIIRKDYVSKLEDLYHSCFTDDGDITKYAKLVRPSESIVHNDLQKAHLFFAGKVNLSLENSVSDSLYWLIYEAIKIGQSHPNQNPSSLYPKVSRATFTKRFINQGFQLYDELLENYKQIKYVALAVDAGKEGSKSYFDILITNSLHNLKPLIYKAIEYFPGDFDSYHNEIVNAITELESRGYIVTGIVSDGLRVQSKAILAAQKTIGNTFIKVPCSCHCLNLAINDFMDSLENANKCIETFSIVFSSRPVTSRLKLSCPKRCLTRWSNIFEICSFIVINNEAIEKFLSNKNNIKLSSFHKSTEIILNCINAAKYWAPMLTILLLPFKILSEKLEGDTVCAGYTYGYTQSAIILLEQLIFNSPLEEQGLNLIKSIHDRIDFTQSGTLLRLLFHLTPKGRKIFIERNNRSPDELKLLYDELFPLNPTEKSTDVVEIARTLYECQDQHFVDIIQEIENEELFSVKEDDKQIQDSESEEEEDQETNETRVVVDGNTHQIESDDEEDSYDEETDEYLSYAYFYEYESIFEAETESEKQINFDLEGQIILDYAFALKLNGDLATQAYSAWLEPTDSLITSNMQTNIRLEDINGTWRFFEKCPLFYDLSQIALRFLSVPSSEASAERILYKQRKIITKQRTKTSNSLQFSRITYMSHE